MKNKKLNLSENLREKLETYYLLALEAGKILPWELNVPERKIRNLFGLKMFFLDRMETLDFDKALKMVHPDDLPMVEPLINEILAGKKREISFECRMVVGDPPGINRWIRFVAKVVEANEQGMPVLIAGINQDINDAKVNEVEKTEQAQKLKESEKKLKNAMRMGKISPWEYDFSTGKIITDRNMAEMWDMVGYYEKGEPVEPAILRERIYPEDREVVKNFFYKTIDSGTEFDLQFRINANSVLKYIHCHCEKVTDEEGKRPKLIGLGQEVTRYKKLEQSLIKQYERLKFISDQAGLGLWQMNIKTRIMSYLNKQQNFFDPSNDDNSFSFDKLRENTHPEDCSFLENKFEQLFNGSENRIELEARFLVEGAYRWVYIYGMVKFSSENIPESVEGLYQDVTEKKEIEGRLYQSQKMEAIGRLAGGVAHDFNNILQVIMGYSSLALMGTDSESEVFEYISNIADSGEKARSLVRQLLLFARKEKFRPAFFALNEMAANMIRLFKRIMGDNIFIEFKPDPDLHNVYADSGQIEQVLMNLCINAKDVMVNGGKILVKTKNIELTESWVGADNTIPKGNYVIIAVSDTGPGIPSEHMSKIFEPFFTTKERSRGTGLGLATVYSIIKQHGGYVDVASIEGKGTTFQIYLPVAEAGEDAADEVKQENYPRGFIGNGNILLAEDDEKIREYAKLILTDAGYTVFDCANGKEALDIYLKVKENIDILVFDIMMPVKNGWDAYREISRHRPEIPVVFFSGYDENILSPHFIDPENIKYIQKPFRYFVLINTVQELIDKIKSA